MPLRSLTSACVPAAAFALSLALLTARLEAAFVRGDTNGDRSVNIADPIQSLAYLFTGGAVPCLDAADSNDDGTVNIGDPIHTLAYLFSAGPPPPPPFPNCAEDPTADALGCATPTVGGICVPPGPPAPPVIVQPYSDLQVTGTFEVLFQTDPTAYSDPNGDPWEATEWQVRETVGGAVVWQTGFVSTPPESLYRADLASGTFVGPLLGKTELNFLTSYQLAVRYRDTDGFVSAEEVRPFSTTGATQPVPGAGTWLVRPGYTVEVEQTGLRLPIGIAFVPDPGPDPDDPLYYVAEWYGSIQVVRNDGTRQAFATGLLDYNPAGPIPGSGEQGVGGIAVERDAVNPEIYHLYVSMLWDNGSPPGGPNHYPKVERLTSAAGGLSMASRTVLLNMQPETQGQAHHIGNVTIGPDGKLYVHMGDGFNSSTALNLDQYRGKVLRMNKDGTPVATGDPAGANPFYDAAGGINSRDYIYTYGHRHPFGGAWRAADGRLWVVEQGNSLDRMVDLVAGASYGWAGNDAVLVSLSKYVWNPEASPLRADFIEGSKFAGSEFPPVTFGHAYVSLAGIPYAAGPQQRSKAIAEFPDLTTLDAFGKLLVPPTPLVRYNGTGRSTVAALAAGPDGLYFSDLFEETGASGATAPGANILRVRASADTGGLPPTVAAPATADPNPLYLGDSAAISVLGSDDGGEAALVYEWVVAAGPSPVVFSENGTNAAKDTFVSFIANGTYDLSAVMRDEGGLIAVSDVSVEVSSLLSDTGDGLAGTYYDNINFTGITVSRLDPEIDFEWGAGPPAAGIGANSFSVRWTGFVVPRFTETYTFYTTTDDGVRLWVQNLTTPIIDQWIDQSGVTHTGTISLSANTAYAIRMDYYENSGDATARLEWQSPSQPREVVPQGRLHSVQPTIPNAPTNLQCVPAASDRIDLSWNDASNDEAGFRIERSFNGVFYSLLATTPAGVASFVDEGLVPSTLYFYRVRATNPAGGSGFVTGSATTLP